MKVILAGNAGFCMGVRRAVETTLEMVRQDAEIATYGPLIHNPQVLDLLEDRGVTILNEIPKKSDGTIIIRAHGVPPGKKLQLKDSGARVKDATCPRVLRVQAIIKKHRSRGYYTVIIGDRNHAEVEGLLGYASGRGQVVSRDEEVKALELSLPYIIVSQTTQDKESFERISGLILGKYPGGKVFNTICDSTHKRQDAVLQLSEQVQAIVVVGGKKSANTKRLGEIVKKKGLPVFYVETEKELNLREFSRFDRVGVTAGASTPSWMINRVIRALESVPGQDEGLARSLIYRLQGFLNASNLLVSAGGGLLAGVTSLLMGNGWEAVGFMVVFGYLLAMHNVNRFYAPGDGRFSDPVRERFWGKYRWPFLLVSVAFLANSFRLAMAEEGYSPGLLVILSCLGFLYSVPIIPRVLSEVVKIRRLKEIPGSKTLFVSLAWAFVIVLVPIFGNAEMVDFKRTMPAFLLVFMLAYIRSALFDVFDVQGDRLVGKETLPVCLGQAKTLRLLYILTILLFILLTGGTWLSWFSPLGLWLLPAAVYLLAIIFLYERGKVGQGPRLEFALDSVFLVIAALAALSRLW